MDAIFLDYFMVTRQACLALTIIIYHYLSLFQNHQNLVLTLLNLLNSHMMMRDDDDKNILLSFQSV